MGLIRFFLASFVVLYHCGQFDSFNFMQGQEAVQTFYIISGFYMALIINEKYNSQKNAYSLFITNRLLKLLPIYWLLLILILLISIFIYVNSNGTNWSFFYSFKEHTFSLITILYLSATNLFILGQDVSLYLGFNSLNGSLFFTNSFQLSTPPVYSFMLIPQAWTISLEIMFYLIAPFIVKRKTFIILLFISLTIALKWILSQNGFVYDPWSYRFFPAELFYFLLGVLSYKLYAATKNIFLPKWVLYATTFVTALVVIFFYYLQLQFHRHLFFVSFAIVIPFIFRATKYSKWDRLIGEFSYPIYISHVFFKTLYFIIIGGAANVSIPVLIASICFAILYNEFLFKKIEIYRQKRVLIQTKSTI